MHQRSIGIGSLHQKMKGGAGLIDIHMKHQAMQLDWVGRAYHNKNIQNLADHALENKLGKLIWKANLSEKDIPVICNAQNFWRDTLGTWARYHCKHQKLVRKSGNN